MTPQEAKYQRMTTEPVSRLVTSLAIPSMGSMMVSALYNIVDTYFVSQTGTQATAALGVVFTYMVLIQAFSFFFGQGSGNYISRALGARRTEQAAQIAATGFFSAMFFSATLGAIGFLFMKPILTALGSTPTIMPYACSYFQWLLLGSPFISCTFVLNNQMRFQGNAAMALTGTMTGAIINMGLDPILIFGFKMGVAGAGGLAIRWCNFHPTLLQYREIARGGLPSLGRQGTMGLSALVLNNVAGCYGDAAIAAFSIVHRIVMFVQSLLIGFGQGFQPVCGFNYGAKLYGRVRAAFKFCATTTTLYSILLVVLGLFFAPTIVGLFQSDDARVLTLGTRILRLQCLTYAVTGFVITSNMFLQNIGATWSALITGIAKQGLFLIPALFLLHITLGLDGVLAAQPVSDLCSIFLAIPLWWKHYRKMDYLEKQKQ